MFGKAKVTEKPVRDGGYKEKFIKAGKVQDTDKESTSQQNGKDKKGENRQEKGKEEGIKKQNISQVLDTPIYEKYLRAAVNAGGNTAGVSATVMLSGEENLNSKEIAQRRVATLANEIGKQNANSVLHKVSRDPLLNKLTRELHEFLVTEKALEILVQKEVYTLADALEASFVITGKTAKESKQLLHVFSGIVDSLYKMKLDPTTAYEIMHNAIDNTVVLYRRVGKIKSVTSAATINQFVLDQILQFLHLLNEEYCMDNLWDEVFDKFGVVTMTSEDSIGGENLESVKNERVQESAVDSVTEEIKITKETERTKESSTEFFNEESNVHGAEDTVKEDDIEMIVREEDGSETKDDSMLLGEKDTTDNKMSEPETEKQDALIGKVGSVMKLKPVDDLTEKGNTDAIKTQEFVIVIANNYASRIMLSSQYLESVLSKIALLSNVTYGKLEIPLWYDACEYTLHEKGEHVILSSLDAKNCDYKNFGMTQTLQDLEEISRRYVDATILVLYTNVLDKPACEGILKEYLCGNTLVMNGNNVSFMGINSCADLPIFDEYAGSVVLTTDILSNDLLCSQYITSHLDHLR